MSKITLPAVVNTTNVSTINSNFQVIAEQLNDKVLYRNNPLFEPNQMITPLDMNSNRILNLPKPISALEPVRRIDVVDTSTVSSEIIAQAVVDATQAATAAQSAKASADGSATAASGYAQDAYNNSRLTVGTVTTGAAGTQAAVNINGAPGSQIIDFTIPRGASGDEGVGGKVRIVVLGDSMTARQVGLDEVWPDALASALNAAGSNVEVFNLAVNGATHYSAMTDMLYGGKSQVSMAIEYAPDIVIVALGLNDGYRAASVSTPTVITEATNLYAALTSGLPTATIVYASETFYDRTHGSPATLTNEQTFPIFAKPRTTGLLANMYAPEILPEASSTGHRNAVAAWVAVDTAIKGFGKPWFELPLWQACRLGLSQSDAFHINYPGHRFVTAAAFNWCRSFTSRFPNLGTQGLNSWNDWQTAFNVMLQSDGNRFVNKDVVGGDAGQVCYWGPWNTAIRERWYSQSKGSVQYDLFGTNYVKRQNVWGFTITGALPGASILQSSDETTWQYLGVADSRGMFRYSILLDGLGVPNGSYTHRVRMGNDVTSRFDYTVSGTGYLTATSLPLTSLEQGGASAGQVLTWSGTAWAPSATGGGKAYFLAAGSASAVAPSRGNHVAVPVTGSTSSNPSNVVSSGSYWLGASAPSSGLYQVTLTVWTSEAGYAGRLYGSVLVDGSVRYNMGFSQTPTPGDLSGASFSVTVQASAGQVIQPFLFTPAGSGQVSSVANSAGDRWNTWSIVQIA